MKRSRYLALAIAIVVIAWMLTGNVRTSLSANTATGQPPQSESTDPSRVLVQTETLVASTITRQLTLQGQAEPFRIATLRAETAGKVIELPVKRGQRVESGQLLVRLSVEDRSARLAQAEALLRQRRSDLTASQSLHAKGLRADNQIIQEQALVAAAEADLERARIELANTRIHAPFTAILDRRNLELGDFVDRADPIATLVDDSRILVTAQIPQRNLSQLTLGQRVNVQLITGQSLTGTLSYIAARADEQTRSYRIEVETANPQGERWIGLSAQLQIPVEQIQAHLLSPSLLNLDSEGALGIKTLGPSNRIDVLPVSIIRSSADGIWVSGLPSPVTLITKGQGFYQQGETVDRVAASPTASDQG